VTPSTLAAYRQKVKSKHKDIFISLFVRTRRPIKKGKSGRWRVVFYPIAQDVYAYGASVEPKRRGLQLSGRKGASAVFRHPRSWTTLPRRQARRPFSPDRSSRLSAEQRRIGRMFAGACQGRAVIFCFACGAIQNSSRLSESSEMSALCNYSDNANRRELDRSSSSKRRKELVRSIAQLLGLLR
jgi:hypothetical protein